MKHAEIKKRLAGFTDGTTLDALPEEWRPAFYHYINDSGVNSEKMMTAHSWGRKLP